MFMRKLTAIAGCLAILGASVAFYATYTGQSVRMGKGKVTSWVKTDSKGAPTAIGVKFPRSILSGLPSVQTGYPIAIPVQAKMTGIDHIELNWEPHGHIPKGIYDVPHVDFHFYLISRALQNSITATGADLARVNKKPASAAYVPTGYQLAPGGEMPKMGSHWVDLSSPEFQGKPFGHTFIYGFYNGGMAFIEPMITRNYLLSGKGFSQSVAVPQKYPKAGYFPTTYGMAYNPKTQNYIVYLAGLVKR